MIGETVSHYKILSRLGAGGMGVVYEAEDTRLGRKVAIKFLPDDAHADEETVQRFQREARVISNLNHPHICTLYDIGTHQNQQFMVMELLEGQSLKDRIARGALALDEVLELGGQMADALDAAHAQGIVHRDLKPANLFVTRRGAIKVLDFGVAKLGQSSHGDLDVTAAQSDQLTTLGTTIGTVSYMSPEQARGQEIDARSDVFSAGVVLYEMATGRLPFTGQTVATIFEGLLTKTPDAPSSIKAGLPPEFDHIVFKALEKDRETRYQGAAELRADLKRLKRAADSGDTAATAAGVTSRRPAPARLPAEAASSAWRTPLMIGAPLVTAALVGAFLLYRSITTPALADKDTVVLSTVVNRTGDTMFDDTLGEALAMQLRQSPFLNLVADPQVQGTLRLMGRDPASEVTSEVGREVCQRVGAKAVLGGAIAMLGSSYVITLNAQDCVTGEVLAEEQVQAPNKESVLSALGGAVSAFRERLGESLASIQRFDAKIEEASTPSLEALKAYSQGMVARRVQGDFESVPFFLRAIELDPDFALAHARIGTVYANLGQTENARKHTTRAYELRNRVSDRERLYIEARYHSTVVPDVGKAIDAYKLLLASYPTDYAAWGNMGTLLRQRGDLAAAVSAMEEAIRLAPEQPVAYGNLGSAYTDLQRYDDARRTYEALLKLQDGSGPRIGLYVIGILTGDQSLADAQVEAVRGHRDESQMTGVRIQGLAYQGRVREAHELWPTFLFQMEQTSRRALAGEPGIGLAITDALVGYPDRASARLRELEDEDLLTPATIEEQMVLAALMRDRALADRALPQAMKASDNQNETDRANAHRFLRALHQLASGNPAAAADEMNGVPMTPNYSQVQALLASAHIGAGRTAEAIKVLQWLDSPDSRLGLGVGVVRGYVKVQLARELAHAGRVAEARAAYQQFFDHWKAADADLPLLTQAREEFSKLGS